MIITILKKVYRSLRAFRDFLRRQLLLEIKCPHTWYGNDYGGFYICPEMLAPPPLATETIVYSCGVGEDISFDTAVMRDFNCRVFAFDPTPKAIEWVRKQEMPDNFTFFPFGISGKTENQTLHLSNTPLDVSASIYVHSYTSGSDSITVPMKSLKDIAGEHSHTYIDILKMDIEGSEFSIIENFPEDITFGQLCIEFHERFITNGKAALRRSMMILKEKGYYCFAISKHGDEYSFINKKEYRRRVCGETLSKP